MKVITLNELLTNKKYRNLSIGELSYLIGWQISVEDYNELDGWGSFKKAEILKNKWDAEAKAEENMKRLEMDCDKIMCVMTHDIFSKDFRRNFILMKLSKWANMAEEKKEEVREAGYYWVELDNGKKEIAEYNGMFFYRTGFAFGTKEESFKNVSPPSTRIKEIDF